ncbi:KRAB-A domain-containing protein 2-like [Haliotis rubra]|uniref:KRAB-A domain-containing protein 2-like n=1 Tax=Haliotis rubra TaxID=36100 RepID=UPI001EE57ACA|nr:KRAB-A domain-containing protein 2-like [Haliotis rubra]
MELEENFTQSLYKIYEENKRVLIPIEEYGKILSEIIDATNTSKKTPEESDNGSEFTAQVIADLKQMWPDLVIVHGKPRHPQSQGSVERANCDIKDMLVAWLGDNNTTDWTVGLKLVQFQKNSSFHSGIKCSPFAALLGEDASTGPTSPSPPHEITQKLQSEDDLLSVVSNPTSSEESDTSTDPPPETDFATPASSESPSESTIETRQEDIHLKRKQANEAQMQQTERMVKRSRRVMT